MPAHNTGMAAEFYVLSALHRLGLPASLTLGNQKSVDIVIPMGNGRARTIDVKAQAGATGWFVNNVKSHPEHFVVFIAFRGQIADLATVPDVYVVPSHAVRKVESTHPSKNRVVHYAKLRDLGAKYRNAWEQLQTPA